MVFTAVLAAIAVIAAMVTVPGGKADAAEPTDYRPNTDLGNRDLIASKGVDDSWGPLRTRRLRILGRSARRGLATRVLRSSHVRWLLLRSCGLFRATTVVRQTRLIYRNNALRET